MRLTRIFRTTGFRLAALYGGLFGLSVIILFGVVYWITSDTVHQQLTATIENEVTALVADHKSGGLAHVANSIEHRRSSNTGPTLFYLLLNRKGQKIAGNAPRMAPRAGWQELSLPRRSDEEPGEHFRHDSEHSLLALGVELSDGAFLLVGEDTYHIVELQEAIVGAFAWALGITILLGCLGGIALSSGFLRRIDAINRTSRAIIEGRLSDRVPTRGTDDELDRLSLNLNEMLDRVQALMESLRQVSNDIAHDLRTPLSRLRQRLEDVRLSANSIEEYEAAVDQTIADTGGILKTFSALLRISQIEAGSRKAAFSNVDLSTLFQSIADTYGAVAEDQGQLLSSAIEPNLTYRGDRELLTQMLANLVENAIRHTPAGTHIMLSLERQSGRPIATVADDGPGIPAEAREKVFRRFFRLEGGRSSAGSGLGLSLVAAVTNIHGIEIRLTDNEPGVRVTLDFAS